MTFVFFSFGVIFEDIYIYIFFFLWGGVTSNFDNFMGYFLK